MPEYHPCPYLAAAVEITDERYAHVPMRHNDFASAYWQRAGETLQDPDLIIIRQQDKGAIMLYRWYDDIEKKVNCFGPKTENHL